MEKTLQSFHQKCTQYITGKHIRPDPTDIEGKIWICPPSEGVLEEIGLSPIQEYISQKRNTIQSYVSSRPIYERCLRSKPLVRNMRQSVWWKHQTGESHN
jgi:hypothetical protein